jgi:hypothetical protein
MLILLWRMGKGYFLRPWASPYLRWRMETYSGVEAGEITFLGFWKEMWRSRAPFLGYLKWAADMSKSTNRRLDERRHRSRTGTA